MVPYDRVNGAHGAPVAGWTGRWTDGVTHLLDPAQGSLSRDAVESEDLDAIASLEASLDAAERSGSWLTLADVPLLAGNDDETLSLQQREQVLAANLASIARVCERFITRLGERSELLPVSRVKRPARRALERLSAHTEDWATRTLSGPVPRRALAVTREEDADLYENRMVTELVHPILTSALSDRIRRLRRITSDLADLESAEDEGTHYRRYRLYTFWGADAARAAASKGQASQTLRGAGEARRLGAVAAGEHAEPWRCAAAGPASEASGIRTSSRTTATTGRQDSSGPPMNGNPKPTKPRRNGRRVSCHGTAHSTTTF